MGLAAPLAEFTQLVSERLKVSCNTNPGVFGDHESVACPAPEGTMNNVGAPSVWPCPDLVDRCWVSV